MTGARLQAIAGNELHWPLKAADLDARDSDLAANDAGGTFLFHLSLICCTVPFHHTVYPFKLNLF